MDYETDVSQEPIENNLNGKPLKKNFEERSDITQEIIRRKPDFFEKWALLVFLILFVLLTAVWKLFEHISDSFYFLRWTQSHAVKCLRSSLGRTPSIFLWCGHRLRLTEFTVCMNVQTASIASLGKIQLRKKSL